jgi:hypothetical protein
MSDRPQSLTRQAIAAISGGPCATVLKPRGFRRNAPNYWRETEGIFQSINFQASQWGSHAEGSFTINLGVTSPTLYEVFTGRDLPKNPAGLLWPVNRRIGSLMPSRCDLWWKVDERTDLAKLGREVASSLEEIALPFLDVVRTPEQLYAAVLSDSSVTGLTEAQLVLVRATLAVQLGDKATARALLDDALDKYRGKPFETTVQQTVALLRPSLDDV